MSKIVKNPAVVSGAIIYTNAADVTLVSNTNDLNIPNIASNVLIRITTQGNYSLTGIINPDLLGRQIFIFNVGTNNLTLKNNDAGSSANNRFLLGSDRTVQANEGIAMVYDVVSLRWRGYGIIL